MVEFENFIPTINYNITYVDLILEGRRHDSAMFADSGLLQDLEKNAFSTTREPMALYGDPAYPLRVHLQVPYRGVGLTPQMELYNKAMSSVRMSAEWLFGDIVNYFKFLDFKKNLKISLSAVGKMYIVAAILRNALMYVRQLNFGVFCFGPSYYSRLFCLIRNTKRPVSVTLV